MATYLELRDLFGDDALLRRIEVAISIAANDILQGNDTSSPPYEQTIVQHENRLRWAASAIINTRQGAKNALKVILAANNTLTTLQIQGASDEAIQSNVEAVIDGVALALHQPIL